MGRDSASEEEWGLLRFVAYEFLADDMHFQSKAEEYEFLEELGFETPISWVIEGLSKDTFLNEIPSIVEDCAEEVLFPAEEETGGAVCGSSTALLAYDREYRHLFSSLGVLYELS